MKAKPWGVTLMVALAWVLWVQNTPEKGQERWAVIDGYDTLEACHQGRTRRMELLTRSYGYQPLRDISNIVSSKRGRLTKTIMCLPGTVDPRPRN